MALESLAIIAGVVIGWMRKGSLLSLTNLRLRWIWLLPISYVLQSVSIHLLNGVLYEAAIMFSYLALLAFSLFNAKVPGLLWTLGGTLSNFVVMLANGLRMPAYLPPIEKLTPQVVPLLEHGGLGKSIAMSSATHLNFLGDIFYLKLIPPTLVSIGDILFAIGIVLFIQKTMTSRKAGMKGEQDSVTAP